MHPLFTLCNDTVGHERSDLASAFLLCADRVNWDTAHSSYKVEQ